MKGLRTILIASLLSSLTVHAEDSKKFTITASGDCMDAPVCISLQELGYQTYPGAVTIYELIDNKERAVPTQLESGYLSNVWFILDGVTAKDSKRTFILKTEEETPTVGRKSDLDLIKEPDNLVIRYKEQTVLKYRFTPMFPPEGVDPLYTRSGFIHPLCSPAGEVLTRVQAPDHYHHYGIWGPWTLTYIEGREVDFWNLAKGEGTVEFGSFLSEISGEVYVGFKALQQHLDFGVAVEERVALNEILDVRVWNINEKIRVIDYTTTLNSPLPNGILLDAYRYGGGIGFRATEKWTNENCTVLTSEGKTRKEADGSHARWCVVEGASEVEEGRSGILFLSHPLNRAHPEPMRVWPLDANGGRGDMFFEFSPIRHQSWKLQRGSNYTLKYRMIVFDGEIDKKTAEMYWNSFALTLEIDT